MHDKTLNIHNMKSAFQIKHSVYLLMIFKSTGHLKKQLCSLLRAFGNFLYIWSPTITSV